MDIVLKIWRQKSATDKGAMQEYQLKDISSDMSFLEMLDVLNEKLIVEKHPDGPVAFDSDCREGICGTCGVMINGRAHGPLDKTTTCQLHMRSFKDKDTIYVEPFRAKSFSIIRDLTVDRSSFDKIIQRGGYVSVTTGGACDANSVLVSKEQADQAMDNAACIGCGACVASCKNASAMLFTAAKVSHLGLLPQGQPERFSRVDNMVKAMVDEGFGGCTNEGECEAVCPKGITLGSIARLNRDFLYGKIKPREL
ncbi:MAG: succinate dehydrogenase/fumarate reductase iron-sulfur subunit [SAR324 cluster bacterium]|nr:succinate dehydrogenase/fumarate reductase iron-sulfur subunit [SAR324 cluster bacterium]